MVVLARKCYVFVGSRRVFLPTHIKPIKCHSSDVFVTSWESCKSGKIFAKNNTCVSFFTVRKIGVNF
jgi:hypothetical protein